MLLENWGVGGGANDDLEVGLRNKGWISVNREYIYSSKYKYVQGREYKGRQERGVYWGQWGGVPKVKGLSIGSERGGTIEGFEAKK